MMGQTELRRKLVCFSANEIHGRPEEAYQRLSTAFRMLADGSADADEISVVGRGARSWSLRTEASLIVTLERCDLRKRQQGRKFGGKG